MLFFVDESGHDHGEAPYEILAGVAIAEADLWNLIQAIRAAEIQFFGVHLAEVGVEFKGKKLLKNKTFRHARQGPALEPNRRRDLVHEFLMKGWREQPGGPQETRTRDEFTACGHDRSAGPMGNKRKKAMTGIAAHQSLHHIKQNPGQTATTFLALPMPPTPTTAQSLGALLKSVRDTMRKDKGVNGDHDRLPMLTWVL